MKTSYFRDESGQWWHQGKRQRQRATERTCERCGAKFPSRHPQRFCSKTCVGASQRGNRKGDRPCAWCQKLFTPSGKGNRRKCCSLRCAYDLGNTKRGSKGAKNGRWRGGVRSHSNGYVRQWVEGRGHVLQHRLVMEGVIGRQLERYEEVHHKNGVRNDNRPENLELWAKRQPGGQRVADLIEYARWVLATYGPVEVKVT